MPSFVEIGPQVTEKKIFEGFYHIWVVTWIIYTQIGSHFILNLTLIGQVVSKEKIFEIVDRRRTDAGAWPSYKLTF